MTKTFKGFKRKIDLFFKEFSSQKLLRHYNFDESMQKKLIHGRAILCLTTALNVFNMLYTSQKQQQQQIENTIKNHKFYKTCFSIKNKLSLIIFTRHLSKNRHLYVLIYYKNIKT